MKKVTDVLAEVLLKLIPKKFLEACCIVVFYLLH